MTTSKQVMTVAIGDSAARVIGTRAAQVAVYPVIRDPLDETEVLRS